jgi:hypothetical protein
MKTVFASFAVLTFACSAPAMSAPARTSLGNPFDGYILRPPASIPHARGVHAAVAPLPRAKPVAAARAAPVAASVGPLVFPPVTPLE